MGSKSKIEICLVVAFIIFISIIMSSFIVIKSKELYIKEKAHIYFNQLNLNNDFGGSKNEIKSNYTKSYFTSAPVIHDEKIDKVLDEKIDDIKSNFEDEYTNYINYETYYAPDGLISVSIIDLKYKNDTLKESEIYTYIFDYNRKESVDDSYIFIGEYKNIITDFVNSYIKNNYKDLFLSNYEENVTNNTDYKYVLSNQGLIVYFNHGEITNNVLKILIPYENFENVINIDTINKTTNLEEITTKVQFYTDVNETMYITNITNFYEEDSKASNLIEILNKGDKVEVLSESEDWTRIKFDEKEGYVLNIYLSEEIVCIESMNQKNETVYFINDAFVFKKKDSDSEVLGKMLKDESIKRIGVSSDGWSEVVYNNEAGFVLSNSVSLEKQTTTTTTLTTTTTTIATTLPITTTKKRTTTKTTTTVNKSTKERKIDKNKPMVALTFDDGPNGTSTVRILNTLEKYNVVATFFDLGNMMKSHPDVARREERIGCEVETHTYSHPNLNKLSKSEIKKEMNKAISAYESVLGHKPTLLRAPYGNSNDKVKSVVNMPIINWTIDTLDWKYKNKKKIINAIYNYKNLDGKIVLMHSIHSTTADAVEELIPKLLKDGYQLVTISELAKYKGYSLKKGNVYYSFK